MKFNRLAGYGCRFGVIELSLVRVNGDEQAVKVRIEIGAAGCNGWHGTCAGTNVHTLPCPCIVPIGQLAIFSLQHSGETDAVREPKSDSSCAVKADAEIIQSGDNDLLR
jgi:hypothetical protein